MHLSISDVFSNNSLSFITFTSVLTGQLGQEHKWQGEGHDFFVFGPHKGEGYSFFCRKLGEGIKRIHLEK